MEQTQQQEGNKDAHICKHGSCCHGCCECSCHKGMGRGYWVRRFFVIFVAILLSFWCGYKLGMIKGYLVAETVANTEFSQ